MHHLCHWMDSNRIIKEQYKLSEVESELSKQQRYRRGGGEKRLSHKQRNEQIKIRVNTNVLNNMEWERMHKGDKHTQNVHVS